MTDLFVLMLAVVFVIAIGSGIGVIGMIYLVEWLKSKLMRSRKTKTDHTH